MSDLPKTWEYEEAYDTGTPERRMTEVAFLKLKADAMRDELLTRIAELEAENKTLGGIIDGLSGVFVIAGEDAMERNARIAELEAALAAALAEKRDFYETIDLSTFNHAVDRAEQAEAALAERDGMLEDERDLAAQHHRMSQHYEWQRDYAESLVLLLVGTMDGIMQDVWERRFQEPGVDLLARAATSVT